MRLHILQVFFIAFDYLFDSTHNGRIEKVAVQGETLSYAFVVRRQLGSEPIQRYLVVVVEVLEDAHNFSDSLDVGIGIVFNLVQG